jgi:hypothetical protein
MADQPANAARPLRAALLRAPPVHDETVDIVAPQPLSRLHADESATICRRRRRTQRADDDADFAQPERARCLAGRLADAKPANEPPNSPSPSRPSAAERVEAAEAISILQELKLLRGKATAVEPNVIALALAWRRGDGALNGLTQSERNVLFGVPPTAMVADRYHGAHTWTLPTPPRGSRAARGVHRRLGALQNSPSTSASGRERAWKRG